MRLSRKRRTASRSACTSTTPNSRLRFTAPSAAPIATPTSRRFPHDPTPAKPMCATCHAGEQTAYDHGVHAKAAAAGNTNVAKCQDCHGSVHELLPSSDPKSKVAHANIPQTCGACHGQKFAMASGGMTAAAFNSYQQSVHGKAVAAGSEKAAVCTDCHGEHDILSAVDPKSPINKFNVPTTCAKCHANVKARVHAEHPRPGQSRAATGRRRCAPTATAFTPSRRRRMRTLRWRRPT